MENESQVKAKKKDSGLLNLLVNVVLPSVILVKFSKDKYLGQNLALCLALSLPLIYGLVEYWKSKKFNFFSGLGLVSVLLTGGIGLFKLDKDWMIVKETAIPLIIGIAVFVSMKTKSPLAKIFLEQIFDLDKIDQSLREHGHPDEYKKRMWQTNLLMGISFFVSAALNFALAYYILEGQPGSVEFNESLGKMNALSFPVITIPSMIIVMISLMLLIKSVTDKTNLTFEDMVNQ